MADEKNVAKTSEKKTAKKSSKGGFFEKIGKFFRDYRSELKKISWPTFSEVVKNTIVTLITVLIVGVFIWIIDYAFGQVRNILLNLSEKNTDSQTEIADSSLEVDDILEGLTGEVEEAGEAVEQAVEEDAASVEESAED